MAEFSIEIAGCGFAVHSLFESTREYCKRYLTEKTPQCQITVEPSMLLFEQETLRREAVEEGLRTRVFPDPFLERASIQRSVAEHLFDRGVLMTHGSTVAVDGRAYLFTAKCGTGKSTHTRLWREVFGSRAVMINDDKPFLRLGETTVTACGSPWSGKHGLDTNISLPLAGICILERGQENHIEPCPADSAMPMLLHQSYCPLAEEKLPAFEALVKRLAENTPLWRMQCNRDPEAALTAYRAMSE